MKPAFPITKEKVKTHFAYAWWQYALLVALSFFIWNLLFTTTHYRSPENLKVEWYYAGFQSEAEKDINALMDEIHAAVLPDMEEVTFSPVTLDDTYGTMQLTIWASAGTGDVFMVSRDYFLTLAQNGGLMDLTAAVEDGTLNVGDMDLTKGYAIDAETGKRLLAGIPAEGLAQLKDYGLTLEGNVIGVSLSGGNVDNSFKLLQWLVENMR